VSGVPNDDTTVRLSDYVDVVKRHRFLVISVVVFFLGISLVAAFASPSTYASEARLLVLPTRSPLLTGASGVSVTVPNMADEQAIAASPAVAGAAARSLQDGPTADELEKSVHVSAVNDANVLVIKYSDTDAERASAVADAIARSYITYKEDQTNAQYVASRESVLEALRQIQRQEVNGVAASPEVVAALREKLADLTADFGNVQPARILEQPTVSQYPAGPNRFNYVLVGLILGLGFGVLAAFLVEAFGQKKLTQEALESAAGAPSLGRFSLPQRSFASSGANGDGQWKELAEYFKASGCTSIKALSSRRSTSFAAERLAEALQGKRVAGATRNTTTTTTGSTRVPTKVAGERNRPPGKDQGERNRTTASAYAGRTPSNDGDPDIGDSALCVTDAPALMHPGPLPDWQESWQVLLVVDPKLDDLDLVEGARRRISRLGTNCAGVLEVARRSNKTQQPRPHPEDISGPSR
jgi:capsular polysaccharide biosynthesis protein